MTEESTTETQELIRLEHVGKVFSDGPEDVDALADVNLRVNQGELVSIMGPSGSGKSTLLHILGCLDRPSKGTYRFAGQDTRSFSDRQLANTRNRRIGFVFQSFNLLQQETALENVSLPLMYGGARDVQARAREALSRVGLDKRIGHRPGQLSGGEQQRVAIARAMVKNPDLILADEPTGNLDSKVGANIMALFQEMHQEGITIILITHDHRIASIGTRHLRLLDGRLSAGASKPPAK
jgi:putative ABC transport system ATP-binding protein